MNDAPFEVGQRVAPSQLLTWTYAGLTGKPGRDKHAVRRFTKGHWTLEMQAHENRRANARVVSIRTLEEDANHWQETRDRLMRNRRRP